MASSTSTTAAGIVAVGLGVAVGGIVGAAVGVEVLVSVAVGSGGEIVAAAACPTGWVGEMVCAGTAVCSTAELPGTADCLQPTRISNKKIVLREYLIYLAPDTVNHSPIHQLIISF
jgi:hypothetical protein